MESVQTKSRKPRRPAPQKSQPQQRRSDPAELNVPPTPHVARDWPAIPYESMLAIPIRRRCFAIRRFMGLTNWSSFHWHRSPVQEGDPSSGKPPDPFS